ncbi:MAG TPA: hypothetical protein VLJ38_12010 [Polyangiaceae bacterium]|nr:hypothetical protein [Polyangiaceae bacterium]
MKALGTLVGSMVCVVWLSSAPMAAAQEPAEPAGTTAGADATAAAAPSAPDAANPANAAPAAAAPNAADTAKPIDGAPGTRADEPRFNDANADRAILFSTAETHPKGTFFFSDYELILLQFGYAFTDNLQLTLTGVPPIISQQPYFFDLALKWNFLRTDVVRAAVIGSGMAAFTGQSEEPNSLFGVRLNGVSQFCFETSCKSSFSFNVGTFLNNQSNEVIPITLAGGLIVHVSRVVKLLLEPAYALVVGSGVENQPEGFLLDYGLRLSGNHFGFDLAFIRPFATDSPFILGVPYVAFTYRTSGDGS